MKCKEMPKPDPSPVVAVVCRTCKKGAVIPKVASGATLVKTNQGYICTDCMDAFDRNALKSLPRKKRRPNKFERRKAKKAAVS